LAEATVRRAEEQQREQEAAEQREESRLEEGLRRVQEEQEAAKEAVRKASPARRPSRFAVSSVPGQQEAGGGLGVPDPASQEGVALLQLSQASAEVGTPAKIKGILKHHKDSNFTIHGDPRAAAGGSPSQSPYTTVTGAASERWRNTVQSMQQMFSRW
jgi:hypothetical protein